MNFVVLTLTLGVLSINAIFTQAIAAEPLVAEPVATPVIVEVGQKYTLHSQILGEERQVLVRLPESYNAADTDVRYPVIYLLDGDRHFTHGSIGAEVLEQRDRMPESIIVALPNNHGTRERDLARQPENFRRFMSEELFTFIDTKYRTSGHKTLFGHSLAGYFTLSIMVDHNEMFDNYITASPAVHVRDGELVGKFEQLFASNPTISSTLFLTLTEMAEEGREVTQVLNRLIALFDRSAPESFKWRYNFIDAQVHITTPYLTIYQGFSHAFSDFQAPSYIDIQSFESAGGIAALDAFFAERAIKYGAEEGMPQTTLRQIAYLYSEEGMHTQALALFNKNAQTYPTRPRVYNSLGDGYAAAGQLEDAQKAYQNAVNLAAEQGDEDVDWFSRNLRRNETRMAQE
ncbi:alpha/beta hydrolase-fold protein [Kordiimonas aquimaris]|uniref:alpha/beta hydrolase-fold protein n=1 Tax=Kordiimonas aquimaris TaxID=707591 RepID=UPI0021D0EE0F|nr:alpha/beta hydrolase-fold protein [Kordiimonas aquimaris]